MQSERTDFFVDTLQAAVAVDGYSTAATAISSPALRRDSLRAGPTRAVYRRVKRLADILLVLAVAAPVLIVVALAAVAILIAMGRPVFFVQDRVGRGGRVFRMWKLRTMHCGERIVGHATVKDDPRITPLGHFLRRTHLDELPQLWNMLTGDMTLIGPRPEQPHLADFYAQHIPGYERRHDVTPGLTGLAQVYFGYAADLEETREKAVYDLRYVENMGPLLDARIFVRTVRVYSDPRFVR